jgi:hypothetical protein
LIAIYHGRKIPEWVAFGFFALVSMTCPFVSIKFLLFMHMFEDEMYARSWFEEQEEVEWVCKPYSRVSGVCVTTRRVVYVTITEAFPKLWRDLELLSSNIVRLLCTIPKTSWRMAKIAKEEDQNANTEPIKRGRGRPRKVQSNPRARSRSRG